MKHPHETRTSPTNSVQANDYDSFAEAYTTKSDSGIENAYYERPAILALAGKVSGRHILDAGCGSGPMFAALREKGAIVTGFDKSARMLQQARLRLGPNADLHLADLAGPLPFSDDSFDDVVASLVLHYLEDWGPSLGEIRRILKPSGRFIISVDHPFAINLKHRRAGKKPNYFQTHSRTETWDLRERKVEMSFWHRPLHAMIDDFTAAGFKISVISEPQPLPAARELFPEEFEQLSEGPNFLFFVLQAV